MLLLSRKLVRTFVFFMMEKEGLQHTELLEMKPK